MAFWEKLAGTEDDDDPPQWVMILGVCAFLLLRIVLCFRARVQETRAGREHRYQQVAMNQEPVELELGNII